MSACLLDDGWVGRSVNLSIAQLIGWYVPNANGMFVNIIRGFCVHFVHAFSLWQLLILYSFTAIENYRKSKHSKFMDSRLREKVERLLSLRSYNAKKKKKKKKKRRPILQIWFIITVHKLHNMTGLAGCRGYLMKTNRVITEHKTWQQFTSYKMA